MRVGYNKRVGSVFVIIGLLLFTLAVLAGDFSYLRVLTPVMCFGFGVSMLTRTYFIVDDHSLVVRALVGPATQAYRFDSRAALQFEGTRVFVVQESERKPAKLTAWIADRGDWTAFRAWVQDTQKTDK